MGRRKATYRLVVDDEVRIPPVALSSPRDDGLREDSPPVREVSEWILEQRDGLLVVNKPAGLAVHGGTGLAHGLIDRVRARDSWRDARLGHRLDRGTSGCLFIGLNRRELAHFQEQLSAGQVVKRYFALVAGETCRSARSCGHAAIPTA